MRISAETNFNPICSFLLKFRFREMHFHLYSLICRRKRSFIVVGKICDKIIWIYCNGFIAIVLITKRCKITDEMLRYILRVLSYRVVLTSVLIPEDRQQQTVSDGRGILFTDLTPDTEYQVSTSTLEFLLNCISFFSCIYSSPTRNGAAENRTFDYHFH